MLKTRMYYVYVLKSKKDGSFYTGCTGDLERRISEHNSGLQDSTRSRAPLEIIYYECCIDKADAIVREKYLKSGVGKKFIAQRLKYYLKKNDI